MRTEQKPYASAVRDAGLTLATDLDDMDAYADMWDLMHDERAVAIFADTDEAEAARRAIFGVFDACIESLAADNAVRDAAIPMFWPVNRTEGQLA
ncbi:hypothetical protein A5768_11390 [Mycolicibacterium fortuitum]|uniref:hypothetical protein n=1 Tax=Mycolicibacterium fortuitum TaxID=1766 RepID=UPI0007EA60D9|nr:hypothetical protein [Mycolicibacterium fortuitum]OBG11815.1 hypothetical protein A5768_11390 [Mycolicibacterium fortuitum]